MAEFEPESLDNIEESSPGDNIDIHEQFEELSAKADALREKFGDHPDLLSPLKPGPEGCPEALGESISEHAAEGLKGQIEAAQQHAAEAATNIDTITSRPLPTPKDVEAFYQETLKGAPTGDKKAELEYFFGDLINNQTD